MVIHDKIYLWSPVATVRNCMGMDVVKECGVERTCVKGAALTVLEAKLLPCKKGGGSEAGPNPMALCSAVT